MLALISPKSTEKEQIIKENNSVHHASKKKFNLHTSCLLFEQWTSEGFKLFCYDFKRVRVALFVI